MADVLAEREMLARKQAIYREMIKTTGVTHDRFMRTELKYVTTMKVVDLQKAADELGRKHRELDTKIQELNWKIDLVE